MTEGTERFGLLSFLQTYVGWVKQTWSATGKRPQSNRISNLENSLLHDKFAPTHQSFLNTVPLIVLSVCFLFVACKPGQATVTSKTVVVKKNDEFEDWWNSLPERPAKFGIMYYGGGSGEYFFGVQFDDKSNVVIELDRNNRILGRFSDDFPWPGGFEISELPYGMAIGPHGKMEEGEQ